MSIVNPTYECPISYEFVNNVCVKLVVTLAVASCPEGSSLIDETTCMNENATLSTKSCPTGWFFSSAGVCVSQETCQAITSCAVGTLDPVLNSCISAFTTAAELDCGPNATFLGGYCYESILSEPKLGCTPPYVLRDRQCIQETFFGSELSCPPDAVNAADNLQDGGANTYNPGYIVCHSTTQKPADNFCPNSNATLITVDGVSYCEVDNVEISSLTAVCNVDFTFNSASNMCEKVELQTPQYVCSGVGHEIQYDPLSDTTTCVSKTWTSADEYCADPNATYDNRNCTVVETVAPIHGCANPNHVYTDGQCVETLTSAPLADECSYGSYDSTVDACFMNRFTTGDYNCSRGCNYDPNLGKCSCEYRSDPEIACPTGCSNKDGTCYSQKDGPFITACPAGYTYVEGTDAHHCIMRTYSDVIYTCPNGDVPVNGSCSVQVTKATVPVCPVGYTLGADKKCYVN